MGMESVSKTGTLWVIHIGNDDRIALRALKQGFVCIGWTKLGNLNQYDTRESMKQAMSMAYPDWSSGSIRASYGQPFRFAHEMKIDELVIYPVRATGEIAIGRISGDYEWRDSDEELASNDYCNVREVEWIGDTHPRTAFSQQALHSFGSYSSVSTSNDHLEEVLSIIGLLETPGKPEGPVKDLDINAENTINHLESVQQETEDYLLKKWTSTGVKFEHLVVSIFEAMGFKAKATQPSADHGIDVIAHPDPLGLQKPYIKIQVKSTGTETIGEPQVNQLKGLLNTGESGIYIALSKYSSSALSVERNSPNLSLLGPKDIVRLFLDHYDQLEPSIRALYPLKKVYVPVR